MFFLNLKQLENSKVTCHEERRQGTEVIGGMRFGTPSNGPGLRVFEISM